MAKAPKTVPAAGEDDMVVHVKMVRDPAEHSEPHSADVHPDEVDNYRSGGWVEAD